MEEEQIGGWNLRGYLGERSRSGERRKSRPGSPTQFRALTSLGEDICVNKGTDIGVEKVI
jgi:hypothetical protein